jgi:hypothetical protein
MWSRPLVNHGCSLALLECIGNVCRFVDQCPCSSGFICSAGRRCYPTRYVRPVTGIAVPSSSLSVHPSQLPSGSSPASSIPSNQPSQSPSGIQCCGDGDCTSSSTMSGDFPVPMRPVIRDQMGPVIGYPNGPVQVQERTPHCFENECVECIYASHCGSSMHYLEGSMQLQGRTPHCFEKEFVECTDASHCGSERMIDPSFSPEYECAGNACVVVLCPQGNECSSGYTCDFEYGCYPTRGITLEASVSQNAGS